MKIEIKTLAGTVLFEGDFSCLAKAVEAAVSAGANLRAANLRGANLSGANLSDAYLSDAYLRAANLSGANLSDAKNAELPIARTRILPEGELIGWKKCAGGVIAKLVVPADAKRSHAWGRKCRAEFVRVLELWDGKEAVSGAKSAYENSTVYAPGQTVRPDAWCDDYTQECAGGIHFYITRIEAENHN